MELKQIKGFEGLYSIDTSGNVYSIRNNNLRKLKWNINPKSGYAYVALCKNGKYKNSLVHRLVAETFIPNTQDRKYVDHIDTNKLNNCVSNLCWVTAKENSNNPLTKEHHIDSVYKTWERENYRSTVIQKTKKRWTDESFRERIKNASKQAHSKPVKCIELDITFDSVTEAATYVGGDRGYICKQAKGIYNSAYGYHWTYI